MHISILTKMEIEHHKTHCAINGVYRYTLFPTLELS